MHKHTWLHWADVFRLLIKNFDCSIGIYRFKSAFDWLVIWMGFNQNLTHSTASTFHRFENSLGEWLEQNLNQFDTDRHRWNNTKFNSIQYLMRRTSSEIIEQLAIYCFVWSNFQHSVYRMNKQSIKHKIKPQNSFRTKCKHELMNLIIDWLDRSILLASVSTSLATMKIKFPLFIAVFVVVNALLPELLFQHFTRIQTKFAMQYVLVSHEDSDVQCMASCERYTIRLDRQWWSGFCGGDNKLDEHHAVRRVCRRAPPSSPSPPPLTLNRCVRKYSMPTKIVPIFRAYIFFLISASCQLPELKLVS